MAMLQKSEKLPVQEGLKRRDGTVVVCVAHQPDANAEIQGMLQAKIFQNILCRKHQGSIDFNTS